MAKKYVSTKKYSYNEGSKKKKIILIVAAVLLVVAVAVAAILLLGGGNGGSVGRTYFTVQSMPNKTTFAVGEPASWQGLQVRLVTEMGSVINLGPDSCTITGFDSSAPAESQTITVKYQEYTTTFTITIVDPSQGNQDPSGGNFNGLSFKSKPKTQYKVGEWLDVNGGVVIFHYSNGATKEIPLTYDMVYNFTTAKPGTYTLTVLHIEDGHRATLTYDITVTN